MIYNILQKSCLLLNKTYYLFGQKVVSFWVKSTIVSLKTEVRFTKNGGAFH